MNTNTRPVLTEAVRLRPTYSHERLIAELSAVTGHTWNLQRVYRSGDVGQIAPIDWRVLPLRSLGADPERTDPGGPGPLDFAETKWLDALPYLRSILGDIPAPLNAVRLMALGPGAAAKPHSDPKYRLDRGLTRLHVPIVTSPHAVLVLDGVEHCWQPGTLWYGDFSREHLVRNTGSQTRVHVVIDCLFTRELAEWFPDEWRDALNDGDVLFNRYAPGTAPAAGPPVQAIELTAGFCDFDEEHPLDGPLCPARFESGARRLRVADLEYAMVPVGRDEYRFAGWSEQRTIQFIDHEVVMHERIGRSSTARRVPIPPAQH